uniref:MliC domain-containing protein n=1 Tax=Loa loa TaxID=7209 RepID=A0A1I7VB51_LOALO
MAKLIVYIAFIIYCQAANQNQARNAAAPAQGADARAAAARVGAVAAEITTDYKADELWEDGRLIATTKVNKCMFISYRTDSLVLLNAHNIDELWDNGGWTIVYFGGETVSICGKLSGLDKVKSGKL